MRYSSLQPALGLGFVLAVACTEQVTNDFFDPSTTGESTSTGTNQTTTGDDTSTGESSTSEDPTTTGSTETTGADESSSTTNDSSGQLCGDGQINGNEECDCGGAACTAEGLGNSACVDVSDPLVPGVLTGGTLGCNPASCRFDTSQCVYCGDGEINGNEVCEPKIAIEETCNSLGEGSAGYLVCDEACQYSLAGCTDCGQLFEFEAAACPDGWFNGEIVGGIASNTWACGEAGEYIVGPGVTTTGVWGTNLNGPYADDESGFLASPTIDLTNCVDESVSMTLRHWYNFEGGPGNDDGAIVQASFNGTQWTTIVPVSGSLYIEDPVLDASFLPVDGSAGFSGLGDEGAWVDSVFDVSAYAGSATFQLRFVLGSDFTSQTASQAPAGWYLDRLEVLGSGD